MRGVVAVLGIVCSLLVKGCAPQSLETARFSEEEWERHYDVKEAGLERLLGPMHGQVGHAIIPFGVDGGAVDMYYFPNGIDGTSFATMELIQPDGTGPKPNRVGTYELVTFTKRKMPVSGSEAGAEHPFSMIEQRMQHLMTGIGLYSYQAVLNPGDTCEVPLYEDEPNLCLIFDEYRKDGLGLEIDGRRHCLLLCIEVFRSEMEHARREGSSVVLRKLTEAGHYPYSDLDRQPVFSDHRPPRSSRAADS
ncbi:MAG: suppressor of fused domain protein [Planctomycetota bacterium]|jgi:hypothetical protein